MLRFTSSLRPDYEQALERLIFFNPGQRRAFDGVLDSIETFGAPRLQVEGGRLRVKLEKLEDVQALFALDGKRLVGVTVYSRVKPERLAVIHLAVDEAYSFAGQFGRSPVAIRMVRQVREGARRIKGVETVRVLYGGRRIWDLPVDR
jgi:hypothetical protein